MQATAAACIIYTPAVRFMYVRRNNNAVPITMILCTRDLISQQTESNAVNNSSATGIKFATSCMHAQAHTHQLEDEKTN